MEADKKNSSKKLKEEVKAEILNRAKHLRRNVVQGELLTIDEAAAYIRMGVPTLYQNKDSIPHFHPPKGVILFDSADLDDWLRNSYNPVGTVPA